MADITLNIAANSNGAASSIMELTGAMKELASAMRSVSGVTKKTNVEIKGVGTSARSAGKAAAKASSGFGKFIKSIGRIAFYRAIRSAIRYVTEAFKEGLKNAYEFSKMNGGTLAASMDRLRASAGIMKNQLGAAFGGLISIIAPVVERIIALVTAAANAITRFFAILGGQSQYKKAVSGLEDTASAAGGAGKEIKGLLAAWDELTVIGNESGGGGGGGSSVDYGDMFVYEDTNGEGTFADKIREAFLNEDWKTLGTELGNGINDAINSIDFASLGSEVGKKINALFTTAYWTLNTINFQNIGSSVAELLNGALSEIDFTKVGGTIANVMTSIPGMLIGFINNTDFGLVAKSLSDTLIGLFSGLAENIKSVDWGEFVDNVINGIMDFFMNLDIMGIVSSLLDLAGSIVGGVIEGLGTLVIDIIDALTDPNTWKLLWGWFKDLPAQFLQFGIDVANNFVSPIVDGINDIIDKYNNSGLATIFGKIEPISFQMIPDIPEEKLHENYNKAKEEIEADSRSNPVDIDTNANFTEKSVNGSNSSTALKGFATWDSTANWNAQSTGTSWKGTKFNSTAVWNAQSTGTNWKGTKFNSTAVWNAQSTGEKWKGTKFNSTAVWNAQSTGKSWKGTTFNSTANFTSYKLASGISDGKNIKLNGTVNITKVTGKNKVTTAVNLLKYNGGLYRNGSWSPITSYAGGGSPYGGQIFRARENGNPELVGTIHGSTAVMNNGQIVASVASGVAKAIAGIHFRMVGMNPTAPTVAMNNEQMAISIQDGVERATEEQNDLLRQGLNLLGQIARKEMTITPSAGFGQIVTQSQALYART